MNQVKHKAFDFSVRGEVRYQESMRRHTSWHAGGYAQRACVPFDLPNLSRFLRGYSSGDPVTMIGMGSNLRVRDGGLRGTAVLLHRALNETRLSTTANGGGVIYAEAGVAAPKIAKFAGRNQLDDAGFFAGIPGAIGGAQVSTKHANCIVNLGTATAANIENLIDQVQLVVKHQQGIEMEREIQIIGERA